MRNRGLACWALVAFCSTAPAHADVWDVTGDDTAAGTRNELVHGASQIHDLAARPGPVADVDWYRMSQQRYSSYEIVVDAGSRDLGSAGPLLELVAADASTVIQSSQPAGAGGSRSLRFENPAAGPVNDQRVRVMSAVADGCGSSCGPADTYRIRALDTTCSVSRFNNSATQVTILVVQNTGDTPVDGHVNFWDGAGVLLASQPFSTPAHASAVVNTQPLAPGASGSITLSHTGGYGQISGRASAIEPATGFTFDTPLLPRLLPVQGSGGTKSSGTGLVLNPPSADYGTLFVGADHEQLFTLTNLTGAGTGPLTTTLSGPDGGQFALSSNTCAGNSLAAGASCTLQAGFMPTTGGPKSAVLTFAASPGGAATASLAGSAINANPVFVTSTTTNGSLGGLAQGDSICQTLATNAGLPTGTYRAWLSTTTTDAGSRLGTARGFVLTNGKPFADSQTDLLGSSRVLNPIHTDEHGADVGSDSVWTGTLFSGAVAQPNCGDWLSSSASVFGTTGTTDGGPVAWTVLQFDHTCDEQLRLYCFGANVNAPLNIPSLAGPFAFLTGATFTPGGGLAAADALCAAEQGGISATFKAFLATSTASAASRFDLTGPSHMRVDNQTIGGAQELGGPLPLQSGIWETTSGNYVSTLANSRRAWTGAVGPGFAGTAASTCNDWTSSLPTDTGTMGEPTVVSIGFFSWYPGQACDQPRKIYCVQQ